MVWWQVLLFPFAVLYDLVTRVRNLLYDHQVIKPIRFDTNVIAVGNLSVGGTGKTPMVAYLLDYLAGKGWSPAMLSKGYGRKTTDFRIAGPEESAATLGDEPMMIHLHSPHVPIAVGQERMLAIPYLLFQAPESNIVILDDAFQHRTVDPNLAILMTTYQRPFFEDFVLPSGRLRESRTGAKRAQMVVITGCPAHLTPADQVKLRDQVNLHADIPVYFTSITYGAPRPIFNNGLPLREQVVGISGIASAEGFEQHLQRTFSCRLTHHYADHYAYTRRDVRHLINELDAQTSLVTTEKDMVKLREFSDLASYSCYYIPVQLSFLKDEPLFQQQVDSVLKKDAYEKDPL